MKIDDYSDQIEDIHAEIEAFISPKRCYGDFIELLTPHDIENAIEEDVQTALHSGYWESREKYLSSFSADKKSHIYDVVEQELENVFVAGGSAVIVERLAAVSVDKIQDLAFCAKHLAGRHLLNRKLAVLYAELRYLKSEAEMEIGEETIYGRGGEVIRRLEDLSSLEEYLKNRIRILTGFFRLTSIEGAHGLFVPAYCELSDDSKKTPSPLDLLIASIAENPHLIPDIHHRDFEDIIARIFEEKGVNVELTAATRDGGRDIICTSYKEDGSAKKTAIEVKRYTAQKVSVGKIHAFVGANIADYKNFIFVTTSSYTKPAEDYADKMRKYPGVDSLVLKKHEDVINWAKAHKAELLVPDGD